MIPAVAFGDQGGNRAAQCFRSVDLRLALHGVMAPVVILTAAPEFTG